MVSLDISGFVLCGGRSTRMGRDKALLPFQGRPLAAVIAERVEQAAGSVTLVGSRNLYRTLGWPVIEDEAPGCGPLSGIHAALRSRFRHDTEGSKDSRDDKCGPPGTAPSRKAQNQRLASVAALSDAARLDAARSDAARSDAALSDAARSDAALSDAARSEAAMSDWNLIVACDLPFVTLPFLRHLLELARAENQRPDQGAQLIVPRSERGYELVVVFRSGVAPLAAEAIARHDCKLSHLYGRLRCRFVTPAEWAPFDPDGLLFHNVNTPEDLRGIEGLRD